MRQFPTRLAVMFAALFMMPMAFAQDARYTTIEMSITIDRPAEEVWDKVGEYCDIGEWLEIDCAITSGDGGMGTVRELAGGRVVEILVAQTPLSYGYTQPAVPGEFYDLYHGFMEARPVGEDSSELHYTLVYDVSNMEDPEAVESDRTRRRAMFGAALRNMKQIAESD